MKFFAIAVFLMMPMYSHAEVLFSEIAWMGTTVDANDEWIEIYNFSSEPTDLTGWTLSDGNSLNIELAGIMPPHAVFILERTDDTTVPDFPASLIYTGALTNSGATLTIKDADGQVAGEPLVGGVDWVNIGGNNEHKYTAQVTRTGQWVTGPPTPGMPNVTENELPEDDSNDTTSKPVTSSNNSSGTAKKLVLPDLTLAFTLQAPLVAYVHQPIDFSVEPSGINELLLNSVQFTWNFGDLTTKKGRKFTHSYEYPGTYVMVIDGEFKRHSAQLRHEITVLPVIFSITKNNNGDVQINNDSKYEVDISGYSARGGKTIIFPENTILLPDATLTIQKNKLGSGSAISLLDQEEMIVASTHTVESPIASVQANSQHVVQQINSTAPPKVSQTVSVLDGKFSFIKDTETVPKEVVAEVVAVAEPVEVESNTQNTATLHNTQIPISKEKLPYLGLIGVLSIGMLALYAGKIKS
ncbi:lamin tail domain-containing protein [Candidatus Pacebacteria bacterium]|nr:lamin tail domain-containing protein [Candidatus Paceibacterota bacterium]